MELYTILLSCRGDFATLTRCLESIHTRGGTRSNRIADGTMERTVSWKRRVKSKRPGAAGPNVSRASKRRETLLSAEDECTSQVSCWDLSEGSWCCTPDEVRWGLFTMSTRHGCLASGVQYQHPDTPRHGIFASFLRRFLVPRDERFDWLKASTNICTWAWIRGTQNENVAELLGGSIT